MPSSSKKAQIRIHFRSFAVRISHITHSNGLFLDERDFDILIVEFIFASFVIQI